MYRELLVAIDLSDDSEVIARRSLALAAGWGASVRLLHVVGFLPVEPMGESLVPVAHIDDRVVAEARHELAGLAARLGVPAERAQVVVGAVKVEILRAAREAQADLIVLGARERHGLSILLHRTEDTVLHGAACDVLALRVH
jgi:universal stress protein A